MASPFGIGIGLRDIGRAIDICVWIRETCFNSATQADIVYAGFRDEIARLEGQLHKFRQAFQAASARAATITNYNELLDCQEESAAIVGPVERTLKECKLFLKDNAQLASGNVNPVVNFIWHVTPHGHARVQELRSKIQSHAYRISRTIELQLLTEVHAFVEEIWEHLKKKTSKLPAIPPEIEVFLDNALIRSSPIPLTDRSSIHLEHGVSALLLHLQECTVYTPHPGTDLPLEQKLRLLKAHWLVVTLGASQSFDNSRPGSLCRQMIKKAASDVARMYNTWKIEKWSLEDFASLDEASFSVWPPKEVRKRRDITEAKVGEGKLEELPLVSLDDEQTESLVIFLVNDRTLRTVSVRRFIDDSSGGQTIDRTEKVFDPRTDSFVPLYAIANPRNRIWSVDVNQGKGKFDTYEFENREDVFKLQKAFLGYEPFAFSQPESCAEVYCVVTHQPSSILAHITRDKLSEGRGEVQIWQWPTRSPLPRARQLSTSTNNSSSDARTFRSNSINSTVSDALSKLDPTLFSVTETDHGDHVFADVPPPPLLLSFMENESKETYTIMATELSDLQITESGPLDAKNSQVVLQHVYRKTFAMRRITVKKSKMEPFNLCALVVPGYEGSRGIKSPTVETLECTSMVLFFKDDEEQTEEEKRTAEKKNSGEDKRRDFEVGFKVVDLKRMDQLEKARTALRYAQHQAHKPRRVSTFEETSRRHSAQNQGLAIFRSSTGSTFAQPSSSNQTILGSQPATNNLSHDVDKIGPLSPMTLVGSPSGKSPVPRGKSKSKNPGPSPRWT